MMSDRRIQCSLQSEKSWDPRSDLIPSLYVFECVELELALKLASGDEEEPLESDFSCPIKLHRGRAVIQVVGLYLLYYFTNLGLSYLQIFIGVEEWYQNKDLPHVFNKAVERASLGGALVFTREQVTCGHITLNSFSCGKLLHL